MKKPLSAIALLAATALLALNLAAEPAQEIAKAGDARWEQLVAQYKSDKLWVDLVSTGKIISQFDAYDGKVMLFPKIDFGDFVTDRDGNKYYWYGEKNGFNFYVIKYDPKIQDQLLRLNSALGSQGGEYEVLGRLVDAWEWWGNVIEMEVVAMRVKGRACVLMQDGAPVLVGEKILNDWLAAKASGWTAGIPANASAVPAGLDPESVAKWFLYYGSVKKDQALWVKLCSVDERAVDKKGGLESKGRSWWGMLSKADREYYFVRANAERSDATTKYFMYQIKLNGQDVGSAKPMVVTKDSNGEWRVSSF